jgi:hypothetical protein
MLRFFEKRKNQGIVSNIFFLPVIFQELGIQWSPHLHVIQRHINHQNKHSQEAESVRERVHNTSLSSILPDSYPPYQEPFPWVNSAALGFQDAAYLGKLYFHSQKVSQASHTCSLSHTIWVPLLSESICYLKRFNVEVGEISILPSSHRACV